MHNLSLLLFLLLAGNCHAPQQEQAQSTYTIPPAEQSLFPIKGICLVAPVNKIDSSDLQPIVDVHANSITIMPYAFCRKDDPEVKYNHNGQWWGETDAGVAGSIRLAHAQSLSVMIKPHLWLSRGEYTGAMRYSSDEEWQIWEKSYRDYILHFARLGDSLQAEILCIGTELGASVKDRPQYWKNLISDARNIFHGKITYAANWDDYNDFPYWQLLDYIGVDAYFPLTNEETPSVETLKKSWLPTISLLEKLSRQHNKKILFTEIGYRNTHRSAAKPWEEKEADRNDLAQANCYEAFFSSFTNKKWFAGAYLWKWYAGEGRRRRSEVDYTPQGKEGIKTIKAWYSMYQSK